MRGSVSPRPGHPRFHDSPEERLSNGSTILKSLKGQLKADPPPPPPLFFFLGNAVTSRLFWW
jgi:hypothetical protein